MADSLEGLQFRTFRAMDGFKIIVVGGLKIKMALTTKLAGRNQMELGTTLILMGMQLMVGNRQKVSGTTLTLVAKCKQAGLI